MQEMPYRKAIGSLMYRSAVTRSDITHTVSALSQFFDSLGSIHWEAVKHVSYYLAGTRDFALTCGREWHDLTGYTDTDGGASKEHHNAISSRSLSL
jgi:hypothetical protein